MDGLEWKSVFRIIKMDDLGGKPTIFGNIQIHLFYSGYLLSPKILLQQRGLSSGVGREFSS